MKFEKYKNTKQVKFKSMSEYHLLTHLKNQVQNKRHKKYQQIKEKNTSKHYELYLNKIIFIQRYWRRHLVSKGLKLERLSIREVKIFERNKQINEELHSKLHQLKRRKYELENMDPNIFVERKKNQLENQLKISVRNVLDGADRYAKIKAVLQSEMMSYNEILKENEDLKKVCKEGTVMTESLKEKNQKLSQKIKSLRGVIAEEKTDIMILKQKANTENFSLESYRSD